MNAATPAPPRRLARALARAGWGALAAIHVPILVSVLGSIGGGPSDGRVGSAIALGAAIGLFVLKALDVRFLRLRSPRHACLAFCLATAIVHHDAVARCLDDRTVVEAAVVVSTVIAVRGLARSRAVDLHQTLVAQFAIPAPRLAFAGVSDGAPRSGAEARSCAIGVPRGPPGG